MVQKIRGTPSSTRNRSTPSSAPASASCSSATSPVFSAARIRRHLESRFNPLRGLTPERLGRYLDAFRRGHLRELALVMDLVEQRDDTLAAVVMKTKQSVARHGFEIVTTTPDDPAAPAGAALAAEQAAVLQHFYESGLEVSHAIDGHERGGFSLLIRQMMDAVGKRFAVHAIEWEPAPALTPPGPPSLRARLHFVPLHFFEATTGRLRFLPSDYAPPTEGQPLEHAQWMVTTGPGLMIPSVIAWMCKHLPLQDWLTYSEKFGLPGVLARTDAPPDSPEWEASVEAIRALANDWAAVISRGSEVELLQAPGGAGELPFAGLVERMDRALVTLWRGADLGTMSAHDRVGATLQREECHILEADFANLISECLNHQLTRWVLDYHFGEGAPMLAKIKLRTGSCPVPDQ